MSARSASLWRLAFFALLLYTSYYPSPLLALQQALQPLPLPQLRPALALPRRPAAAAAPPALPAAAGSSPCLANPLLAHCRRWLTGVLPRQRLDIVLVGNELWQQFPLNSYGGIEASVETMAWGLHEMGVPFWVITPGRSAGGAPPEYPFDVLETEAAPNGRGGMVGEYVGQAVRILGARVDARGVAPARVELAHGNASSAQRSASGAQAARCVVVWGQSDWSQGLAGAAAAAVTTHHDGGGPVPGWDRALPNVAHRFLSVDQRSRWVNREERPEQFNRTHIVPHGLNPGDFQLCADGGYFLWVAALDWGWEEKGLHIFVALAKRHPERRFVAYGHAQKKPEVLARLREETRGLANFEYGSALIRGAEHTAAFCGATAFFMPTQPSIGESFGLTVIEALSKGVPVITSTAGAPAEILGVPGRHGTVEVGAACDTLDEYDAALARFSARSPAQSARVQAYALAHYSSHVVVDAMLGLSMELVSGESGCGSAAAGA